MPLALAIDLQNTLLCPLFDLTKRIGAMLRVISQGSHIKKECL